MDRNAAIGLRYDDPQLATIDFGNTWPLLDTNTLTVIGITDEDDPQPFITGNVINGRFVEDENDNLFAARP